jgi:hypothetical protein
MLASNQAARSTITWTRQTGPPGPWTRKSAISPVGQPMTSRRKATLDWEMVGEVGVDTGLVMLSDPSYWIWDRDEDDVRPWADWHAFVDALVGESCRADGPQGLLHRGIGQSLYSKGHPGLGVVVTDFGGDGASSGLCSARSARLHRGRDGPF